MGDATEVLQDVRSLQGSDRMYEFLDPSSAGCALQL